MTHDELAVLRSFAARPNRAIPPGLQAVVEDLRKAGYIICDADGWIATPEGCNAIEHDGKVSRRFPGRDEAPADRVEMAWMF